MEDRFFYLALALILMHEMDAIRCKEWRIFPGLSYLNDTWGLRLFLWAHLPLYYFLLFPLRQKNLENLIYGLDIFFLVHVGLHLLFLLHPKNEFKDSLSWSFILGAGLFGALDLLTKCQVCIWNSG